MANNYLQFSAELPLPAGTQAQAQQVVDREVAAIRDAEDYFGGSIEVEASGVWFYAEESGSPEHMERVARALVEELGIDDAFVLSWAETCSKPRVDEFGGGAFLVRRGHKTLWCNAYLNVVDSDKRRMRPRAR